MFLISSCCGLCTIYWSHVLSEDVVGAAILLPTKVHLILEIWQYLFILFPGSSNPKFIEAEAPQQTNGKW